MKLKHGGEKSTTRKGGKKRLKNERYRDRCDGGGGDMVGIKEKKKHWQVDC